MISLVSAIVVIGILIFFHEFGHFLAAKLVGIRVEVFSLGFGQRIFGIKIDETDYRLSLIPLGGYVKLYGENPEEVKDTERDRAYFFKKPWEKALVVVSGPVANFVLAFFLFFIIYFFAGVYVSPPVIGEVLPGSPAARAGLKKGDLILSINNKKVSSFEDLVFYMRSHSNLSEVILKIKRDGKIFTVKVYPEFKEGYNIFGKKTKIPIIGIKSLPELKHKKLSFFKAIFYAGKKTINLTVLTFKAIYELIKGELPFSTLGGPITIGKMAGESAHLGIWALLSFTALLSVNLGVINLLPIPMLDGGHLVFIFIEALRGRPIPVKVQEIYFKVGIGILVLLSIAVFYNDILRLLKGWKTP